MVLSLRLAHSIAVRSPAPLAPHLLYLAPVAAQFTRRSRTITKRHFLVVSLCFQTLPNKKIYSILHAAKNKKPPPDKSASQ